MHTPSANYGRTARQWHKMWPIFIGTLNFLLRCFHILWELYTNQTLYEKGNCSARNADAKTCPISSLSCSVNEETLSKLPVPLLKNFGNVYNFILQTSAKFPFKVIRYMGKKKNLNAQKAQLGHKKEESV